jgi:hypothetical protein
LQSITEARESIFGIKEWRGDIYGLLFGIVVFAYLSYYDKDETAIKTVLCIFALWFTKVSFKLHDSAKRLNALITLFSDDEIERRLQDRMKSVVENDKSI